MCPRTRGVGFPLYDADHERHRRIAELAAHAEEVAAAVELPVASFQTQRRHIRDALLADGVADEIDTEVTALVEQASQI